jgi:hypothetical protein
MSSSNPSVLPQAPIPEEFCEKSSVIFMLASSFGSSLPLSKWQQILSRNYTQSGLWIFHVMTPWESVILVQFLIVRLDR